MERQFQNQGSRPLGVGFLRKVEIPGFEPGQREPKSLVLPLHHTSIPVRKDITNFNFLQVRADRKADSIQGILRICL